MPDGLTLGSPRLSPPELALFNRALTTCTGYFEFGMGGSSLLAVRAAIPAIVLLDSDRAWVDTVRNHPDIAAYAATGRISLLHADIGPVRDWGNPVDRSEITRWHAYLATGWAEWARREQNPDLVFIDGRFRIACAYSVVLACGGGHAFLPPRVMIHDFNDERPQYRQILDCFDIETQVDSLCLLQLRPRVALTDVLARLLRQQFDYG
jgi:hypothetical protein